MDFSYYIDMELDYREADSLGLSLDEYYKFTSALSNHDVSCIEEWKEKNYGTSN